MSPELVLFRAPQLDARELEVIAETEAIRQELDAPGLRQWPGLPWRDIHRRLAGSGGADDSTAAAAGYRAALGLVLELAERPHFRYDEGVLRDLHRLVVADDPKKNPGRWRRGAMLVAWQGRFAGFIDYRAPHFRLVPHLVAQLVEWLNSPAGCPALVRAAMAHLNLAAIHPFLDGNGRTARALHTLVLARAGMRLPAFSSIDEYIAAHSGGYVKAMQDAHGGGWHPERDARAWLRFCLAAHLHQARRLRQRSRDYHRLWQELLQEGARGGLPERVVLALAPAAMGNPVTLDEYRVLAEIPAALAARDLQALQDARLLAPGEGPRAFVAAGALQAIAGRCCEPEARERDPFASVPASSDIRPGP